MTLAKKQPNQPASVKDIEEILNKKLEDYPTKEYLSENFVTLNHFDSRMDEIVKMLDTSAKSYSTFKEEKKVISCRLKDLEILHKEKLEKLRMAPAGKRL